MSSAAAADAGAPLHARTRTPTTPPVESSERRARDGQALHVDVEHPEQSRAVARVRVDLPLHGRDGGAEVCAVRREHRAELLPGRVGIARAEPLGPLERRRDEQRQVRRTIAAPHLGVNDGSVRIANVRSVGAAEPRQRGQDPPVAREHGSDGHRHPVSLERDDPAQDVLDRAAAGSAGRPACSQRTPAGPRAGRAEPGVSDTSS